MANDNAFDPTPRARKRLAGSGEPLPAASLAPLHPLIADLQAARNIPGAQARTKHNKPLASRRAKGKGEARVAHPSREYDPTVFSIRNLAYAPGPSARRAPLQTEAESGPSSTRNATGVGANPSHMVNAIRADESLQFANVATNETSNFVGSTAADTATQNSRLAVIDNQVRQMPHETLIRFAGMKLGTRITIDLHAGSQRMGEVTLAIESIEMRHEERPAQAIVTTPASVGQPMQGWRLVVQNEARAWTAPWIPICKALISAIKIVAAIGLVILVVVSVIALALLSVSWIANCLEHAQPWEGSAAERPPTQHEIFSRIETRSQITLGLLTLPGVTGVVIYWRVHTSRRNIGRLLRFVPKVLRFVPKMRFVPNASASRN